MSQTSYVTVRDDPYKILINGRDYGFYTLVGTNEEVVWMPDSEQQHVNFEYNGGNKGPTKLSEVSEWDVGRMIKQMILIQTKKQTPLEDIVSRHKEVITRILQDFKMYRHQLPVQTLN